MLGKSLLYMMIIFVGTGVAIPQTAGAAEVTGRFILTAQDGQTVSDESFKGRVRMMTFGYTFCPDVCPTTLSTMVSALELMGKDADQVVPIFVTIDPARDTPDILKDYMSAFGPSFVGLTGTREQVDAAAKSFKVRYVIHPPMEGDPKNYLVDHSAGIYIMDRDGRFVAKMGHLSAPEDVAARLRDVACLGTSR